jgi:hypothetical protein
MCERPRPYHGRTDRDVPVTALNQPKAVEGSSEAGLFHGAEWSHESEPWKRIFWEIDLMAWRKL